MSSPVHGTTKKASAAAAARAAALAATWDVMYDKLVQFHQQHGHCRIPRNDPSLQSLYSWAGRQRRHKEALSQSCRTRLEALGFEWTSQRDQIREKQWDDMFGRLEAYKEKHGDCLVPAGYEDRQLVDWVATQRSYYWWEAMPDERVQRLESIGFVWKPGASRVGDDEGDRRSGSPPAAPSAGEQTSWDVMYEKLVRYYTTNGHCIVSQSTNADLYDWILEQRVANEHNELSADKRLKLDQIHFAWTSNDEKQEEAWNKMLESLKAYKAANDDCLVPESYQEDPKLFNWVTSQRNANETGELPQHRRDRLERIGLCWDVRLKAKETKQAPGVAVPDAQPNQSAGGPTSDLLQLSNGEGPLEGARSLMLQTQWDEMFERLKANVAAHGDSFVLGSEDDPQLCTWADTQRFMYRERKLLKDRREKLESIGFAWDATKSKVLRPTESRVGAVLAMNNHSVPVVGEKWNLQLERLKIYQAWHDNCSVPTSYDEELAEWVSRQHYLHKIDKLGQVRYGKLERIGFFSDTPAEGALNQARFVDLARSPKRARVDGIQAFHGRARAEPDSE